MLARIWNGHNRRKRLLEAITSGDLELVKQIIEDGESPNLVVMKLSLLTHALFSTRPREMVQLLLERGARFDRPGNREFLVFAINRDCEMVSLACKFGLNINTRTADGFGILDFALNRQDPALVDFVMELGAEPKVRCRWYAVSGPVIRRLAKWGVEVPDDVRQAVEDGRW